MEIKKVELHRHFEINYITKATSSASIPDPTIPNSSPQKVDFTSRYKNRITTSSSELDEYFRITSVSEPWEIDP